jgi:hypothetical protein
MGDVPMAAKYVELWIMCFLIGMAQLWFIAELYICSRLFLWIKKKDVNEKLDAFAQKCSTGVRSGVIALAVKVLYMFF